MIMTQLPVQATPFANQQAPPVQAQQQQNPFGMSYNSFANIMEPTQLNSNAHQYPSSQANYQFPPQQQQTQTQSTDNTNTSTNASQNATSMKPSNSNNNNLNSSNNNINLNNLNSATSNTYLDQLMRNAYAAQQQGEQHTLQQQQLLQQQQQLQQQNQQQQPWQQQSNLNPFPSQGGQQQGQGHTMDASTGLGGANSGNTGIGITKQQQALFTLGSSVEPVSMKEQPQESRDSLDLAGWKHFWDDDDDDNNDDGSEKITPPAPASVASPSKAKAKRKLQEQSQPHQLQQLQHVRSTDTDTCVCRFTRQKSISQLYHFFLSLTAATYGLIFLPVAVSLECGICSHEYSSSTQCVSASPDTLHGLQCWQLSRRRNE
jgi:hypothetical protein